MVRYKGRKETARCGNGSICLSFTLMFHWYSVSRSLVKERTCVRNISGVRANPWGLMSSSDDGPSLHAQEDAKSGGDLVRLGSGIEICPKQRAVQFNTRTRPISALAL